MVSESLIRGRQTVLLEHLPGERVLDLLTWIGSIKVVPTCHIGNCLWRDPVVVGYLLIVQALDPKSTDAPRCHSIVHVNPLPPGAREVEIVHACVHCVHLPLLWLLPG